MERRTVAKMPAYSVPPGQAAAHSEAGLRRLHEEYGFEGSYTIVKDDLRERRRRAREMYVPLAFHDFPAHHCRLNTGRTFAPPIPLKTWSRMSDSNRRPADYKSRLRLFQGVPGHPLGPSASPRNLRISASLLFSGVAMCFVPCHVPRVARL